MMKQLIKCLSWKLLKQLFIISLISCFILLGNSFVSAAEYVKWLTSSVPWWFNFSLLDYWNFLTNDSYKYFITNEPWYYYSVQWIDWKLYIITSDYNNSLNVMYQWFIDNFWVCPVNTYQCWVWVQSSIEDLSNEDFYSSDIYNNPDYIYIDYLYSNTSFCFWYSDLGVNVCTLFDIYWYTNTLSWSLGFSEVPLPENFNSSSLSSRVWNSPFSSSNWSWNFTPFPTIDYKQCYTLKEILSLRPQYNTWLCYSSTTVFNWSSFESIESESIFDLFPTFEDFNNSINKFQNYCNRFLSVWDSCSNAFSWEYKQYSLVSKLPNDVKRQDLYNYCDKALNYDLNISSCVASGGFAWLNPRTDLVPDELFYRLFNPENWNIPNISWSVYDYVFSIYSSWSLWDFMSSPESRFKLWDDAFSIFPSKWLKWDKVWFLPTYIVIGFLGILLLYMIRR